MDAVRSSLWRELNDAQPSGRGTGATGAEWVAGMSQVISALHRNID